MVRRTANVSSTVPSKQQRYNPLPKVVAAREELLRWFWDIANAGRKRREIEAVLGLSTDVTKAALADQHFEYTKGQVYRLTNLGLKAAAKLVSEDEKQ